MGCRKLSYYENTTAFREASPLKVVYKNPQVCRKEKPVFREVGETLAQNGGSDGSVYSTAIPIAGALAAADGPIPIGDIAGAVVLAGAATYDLTQRTHVTYTLTNTTGRVYIGRTSGYGDPQSIMMRRYAGHHMRAMGYGSPMIDRAVQGADGYFAIRGREQQMIDFHGGIGNVGNAIRGVSKYNPMGRVYHSASNLYFGPLTPYSGL